jgi:hypothetical protein
MEKWTRPQYLQERFGTLSNVYRNSNKFFGPYWDAQKPLARRFTSPVNPYTTDAVAMVSQLLGHTAGEGNGDDEDGSSSRSGSGSGSGSDSDSGSSDGAGGDGADFLYYSGELDRFGDCAVLILW